MRDVPEDQTEGARHNAILREMQEWKGNVVFRGNHAECQDVSDHE
ncbi:MAG: hypothetical protein UZ02_AOB001001797 [Nitrosomonas europaea]|nr:MAG: hypothetical protein UZ02_AOB001001797 [Nitrosomonas europaea]